MATMNGTKRRAVGELTPDDADLDEALERLERRLHVLKDVKHVVNLCVGRDICDIETAHCGVRALSFDDAVSLFNRLRDFESDVTDLICEDEVKKMKAKKKKRRRGKRERVRHRLQPRRTIIARLRHHSVAELDRVVVLSGRA